MGDLGSKVLPPVLEDEVANWTVGSTPRSSSSSLPAASKQYFDHHYQQCNARFNMVIFPSVLPTQGCMGYAV